MPVVVEPVTLTVLQDVQAALEAYSSVYLSGPAAGRGLGCPEATHLPECAGRSR